MGAETILLIVILTFAAGYVLHRWDARRDRSGADRSRKEQDKRLNCQGARIINMSFAGPKDPSLERALKAIYDKGIVLIAAAGNAGPKSPPLYPGAYPNVIAVTATDADDKLFTGANRGKYISVAAPGVDILVPAPEGQYQITTGTSVAAAEVSGIVALLLERNPKLMPADIRRILTMSAKRLGRGDRDDNFGSGLIDPLQALQLADPRIATTTPPRRR